MNLSVNVGNCGFRVKREKKTERSDTLNPQSEIQNLKFPKQIDFHILIGYFIGQTRKNVEIPTH
jgi:hypothetical protein